MVPLRIYTRNSLRPINRFPYFLDKVVQLGIGTGAGGMFRAVRPSLVKFLSFHSFSSSVKSFHSTGRAAVASLNTPSLSPSTIATVKATAPILAEQGYDITLTMYKRMLSEHPKIAELFNPTHQIVLPGEIRARQPWTLACSVHAYAAHVDDLGALSEAVERIAQKHVSLYVRPSHYEVVGENLLWAMEEVLGKDVATPEVMEAWKEAYTFLAHLLIKREDLIYSERDAEPGGWIGWRDFVVDEKVSESVDIASFYLRPKDGGKLPNFLAGQYTAVRLETPDITTQRNYTLSRGPKRPALRITVKRERSLIEGAPEGCVSSYLHDHIGVGDILKLGPPCGDFTVKVDHEKPIILISAGVGVTPVVAMLEYLIDHKVKNNIVMVNTSKNPNVEAMHGLLAKYRRKHLNLVIKTLYSDGPVEYPKGPITMEKLDEVLWNRDAHYYFCGPTGFMKAMYKGLVLDWKVPKDQVHYEFFGPHDELLA